VAPRRVPARASKSFPRTPVPWVLTTGSRGRSGNPCGRCNSDNPQTRLLVRRNASATPKQTVINLALTRVPLASTNHWVSAKVEESCDRWPELVPSHTADARILYPDANDTPLVHNAWPPVRHARLVHTHMLWGSGYPTLCNCLLHFCKDYLHRFWEVRKGNTSAHLQSPNQLRRQCMSCANYASKDQ
jgi:hypothetical protein